MEIKKENIPVLFAKKEDCCGCGACMNICPQKAISMIEDEGGFLYPKIDQSKCIQCEKCKNVCAFQHNEECNQPLKTFAAVAKNKDIIKNSASGGVFAAITEQIIKEGGIVCGAAFQDDWSVHHIIIDNVNQIYKLQGSKYTQSNIDNTYTEVKKVLLQGKKVLYSGTPCQIAGLYGYLGKHDDNLMTIDIVCHGVPNNRMFQDYIKQLEANENGKVRQFTFRDKTIGWGKNGSVNIKADNKNYKKKLWESASSYLYYFSKGWIQREGCYQCKYACSNRPADLTVGDYWGIEKVHSDYLGKKGWDESKGISLVIANTEIGLNLLQKVEKYVELRPSSFEKASMKNSQLNHPVAKGKRERMIQKYVEGGWKFLEKEFQEQVGWRKYTGFLKSWIPSCLKRFLKRL